MNQNCILFVSLASETWGAEYSMVELATQMRDLGREVRLVCVSNAVEQLWIRNISSETVSRIQSWESSTWLNRAKNMASLFFQHSKSNSHLKIVLFSHRSLWALPFFKYAIEFKGLGPKTSWFLDLHDYLPSVQSKLKLKVLTRLLNGIIGVSDFVLRQVPEKVPSIRIARLGTSAEVRQEVRQLRSDTYLANGLRIGVIGRLDPEKGHRIVFKALELSKHEHTAVIRGEASDGHADFATALLSEANKIARGQVIFEGKVSRELAYVDLDAVVVANSFEPMGRTVLEAQLLGIVPIVPNFGGASELVLSCETGLKFEHANPQSLSDTLDKLFDDRKLLTHVRKNLMVLKSQFRGEPNSYAAIYLKFIDRNSK